MEGFSFCNLICSQFFSSFFISQNGNITKLTCYESASSPLKFKIEKYGNIKILSFYNSGSTTWSTSSTWMLLETLGTAYRPSYAMYSTMVFNNYSAVKNGYIRIDTDGKLYIHCLYSSNGESVAGVVGILVYV